MFTSGAWYRKQSTSVMNTGSPLEMDFISLTVTRLNSLHTSFFLMRSMSAEVGALSI